MKTIATINFKGGVGKTTVTWCLGDVLAAFGVSPNVLLFDLDAQMSLTQAIALNSDGSSVGKFARWQARALDNNRDIFSILDLYLDDSLARFQPDRRFVYGLEENYHFVPSTEQLYWLELESSLDPQKGKFFIEELLGCIQNSESLPNYGYVLFDCPPSFTLLSYGVLTCCDLILIPFNPDFFAARGIELLIAGLHQKIRPHPLPRFGVFANRVQTYAGEPTKGAQGWIDDVKEACFRAKKQTKLDVRFMRSWIPFRASLRDAITNRKTPPGLENHFNSLWQEARNML